MKEMKDEKSTYFSEFEKAVYSGDHLKVDAALEEGGQLLTKVIQEAEQKILRRLTGSGTGLCVTSVAYVAVSISAAGAYSHVVVATAGGAVTVYAAVVAKTYFWTESQSETDTALKQEMIVDNIVTRLA